MNKILLISIIILNTQFAFSQTSNFNEQTEEVSNKTRFIATKNVFMYFGLREYNTDLKKSVFKKTEEYKNYESQITELLQSRYNISIPIKNNYDLRTKSIKVKLGENCGTASSPEKCYNVDENWSSLRIRFSKLVTTKTPVGKYGGYSEYINIPLSEERALEVENQKSNFELIITFNIKSALVTIPYKHINLMVMPSDPHSATLKADIVDAYKIHIYLINKTTNEIYFEKTIN